MLLISLVDLDQQLFSLINGEMTSGILDQILVFWRNKYSWIPLYVFILSFVFLNFKKKAYWYTLFLLLTFGVSDTMSSKVIKPLVERPRPCHHNSGVEEARLLVNCGSGYSFTSSHATNHFAIAFFIIFTFGRRRKWVSVPLFIWATLVAYAQVYVGVHFPLDVICGAVLGVCIAFMMKELFGYVIRKLELGSSSVWV